MRTITLAVAGAIFFVFLMWGCSKDNGVASVDESGYAKADGINGGRLYNTFWAHETGYNKADTTRLTQSADFFRCAHCHGWDLLGRDGAFADSAGTKNRPNVANRNLFSASSKSISALFLAIKNGDDPGKRRSLTVDLSTYDPVSNSAVGDEMPKFSEIMSDAQIWDLVKFLKTEAFDVKQVYDCTVSGTYPNATVAFTNIGKDGNAAEGLAYYNQNCKDCHGDAGDGFSMDGGILTVGAHLRLKPFKDAHTFRFGVLGSDMEAKPMTLEQLKNLFKALADPKQFP